MIKTINNGYNSDTPNVYNSDTSKDIKYNEIVHIINSLYKIKHISRKVKYSSEELNKLVLATQLGTEVIEELKTLGVTQQLLLDYDLCFFYSVFKDEFPIDDSPSKV